MIRTIFAALFLTVAVSAGPSQRHSGRIYGGEEVEPNSVPFQISLHQKPGFHFCGGSILDKDTVITAAYCCHLLSPSDVLVVAGEHNLSLESGDEQSVDVEKIITHEFSGSFGNNYNVCLLKLKSSLELNDKVKAVSLPKTDEEFTGDVVVSGWGVDSHLGSFSDVLLAATLHMISDEECEARFPGMIDGTMFCATAPKKDICAGDMGGPLVQGNTLVGISSWGFGCIFTDYPGVYGKVAKFTDWIAEQ
uniref:Trypsin n=1 Tax=Caligus rogercresseyi TaxID=217165 RepID=C1BRH4_CALRO|nr:Trypsin precursor [Caligus rogercresseyi]